jgi:hypothetical protein
MGIVKMATHKDCIVVKWEISGKFTAHLLINKRIPIYWLYFQIFELF